MGRGISDQGTLGALPFSYTRTTPVAGFEPAPPAPPAKEPSSSPPAELKKPRYSKLAGEPARRESTRGRFLRQSCASGQRPRSSPGLGKNQRSKIKDPGIAADQRSAAGLAGLHGRPSLCAVTLLVHHRRNYNRAARTKRHIEFRALSAPHADQGTTNTVEGSNPGLCTGTPRSCRELHH
jgi:hypothetical protein